jgi:hypothetical protein
MYKLEIKLKQHTPIIHFQHDQEGATLRATELKPKLDRYLLKKIGKEEILANNWAKKHSNGSISLTYKVSMLCFDQKDVSIRTRWDDNRRNRETGENERKVKANSYPMILANMDWKDSEDEIKNLALAENCTMNVFSFHRDLLRKIEENIAYFFAETNFGNRQNKGFGSFYVSPQSKYGYKPIEEAFFYANKSIVCWKFKKTDNEGIKNEYKRLFGQIDVIYRLLKSGYNFPDLPRQGRRLDMSAEKGKFHIYQPGFLKLYFLSQKIGSEKRAIKEELLWPAIDKDPNLRKNYYIRALLGITDGHDHRGEWDRDRNRLIRRGKIKIENNSIDRFKSPITFKVIDGFIYMVF